MPDDEIAEIRRIRHRISEECGHDIHRIAQYYRQVEEELRESGEFRFEDRSPDDTGYGYVGYGDTDTGDTDTGDTDTGDTDTGSTLDS